MAECAGDELRYRAFLSYSHKDAAAAARLHRRLEAYRIPRRLAGRDTARGPVPDRLWPIFRDREELPAASDLSETVRAALGQSGALIILCSPNAAASLWVAEEIRVFRELHPDRPILAAILEGDPPDCFPPLLRAMGDGHEPLATDLRRERDGERLGLLKLVAGITGLGLDDLVQRDATRRVRRVMAVTVGAVLAVLVMAVMVVIAINARREAEHQRAEAEGMIEFMLTDLRSRLRQSVGSVEVMQAVNQRALRYYGSSGLDSLPESALEQRARVLHAIGEDDVTRGDFDAALVAFREAHRVTAEQLARTADDPQRIFDHGQSEFWIGRVHELRQDWSRAGPQYDLYARAAERLIAIDPRNSSYMLEMAYGLGARGRVRLSGNHDAIGARQLFEGSAQWFRNAERSASVAGEASIGLANAYANIADTFYAEHQYRSSLDFRTRQYEIMARLQQAVPNDVVRFYRLGLSERSLARMAELAGNEAKVRLFRERALDRARQLTTRDPENAEWLLFRIYVECDRLGETSSNSDGAIRAQFRASIEGAASRLIAQHNPRMGEVQRCLDHLRTPHQER